MMDWYGHGIGGGWGYGLTALIMILFGAAVIYGIVALVRYARPNGTQGPEPVQPPTPERLLAGRAVRYCGRGCLPAAALFCETARSSGRL